MQIEDVPTQCQGERKADVWNEYMQFRDTVHNSLRQKGVGVVWQGDSF